MKETRSILLRAFFGMTIYLGILGLPARAADTPLVSLIVDEQPGNAAKHGMEKIEAALKAKGIAYEISKTVDAARGKMLIAAGLFYGKGQVAAMHKADAPHPEGPEALMIQKSNYRGNPLWLIYGADDRGVMYGELDVADRIGWSSDKANPFAELREADEKPELATRAIVLFTFQRAYWESRFYDEKYWARYLDTLAQNRFNQLVVTFGYENGGFLAPCYPYFFDVDGFPDVKMVGITKEEQAKNLAALNRLISMAHARGIEIKLGIWDHIYRGGVQGGGVPGAEAAARQPTPGLVWGVTAQNLMPYTKAALAELLVKVPGIDAIQFRMHDESGLRPNEQEAFWRDVFKMIKEKAPTMSLDLRAKGLPDEVIQAGLDIGVNLRVSTKWWMEQIGLPYHPTHINRQDQDNRRHSYADLLHYPKTYQIHWQVFNGASTRILLWGDPEFGRRFAESNRLYDADGFEVDEPLCTKMEGQTHDTKPFDLMNAKYRYYDYEFERYWHYFQTYGRMGYNSKTPAEVFDKEFEVRFGMEAGPIIEKALHEASWILPRIVAADFPYNEFAMTYGWPEKERLEDLPNFARAQGSDIAQFENFDEEAQRLIQGGETAKVRPQETSRWFAQTASDIQKAVVEAQSKVGDHKSKEFDSTLVDLNILSDLALYHSRRIPAAVNYRIYQRSRDTGALDAAIEGEKSATEAWKQLVAAAGDVYNENMLMGARRSNLMGHWKDELAALDQGLATLDGQRGKPPVPEGRGRGRRGANNADAATSNTAPAAPAPRYQPIDGKGVGPFVTHKAIVAAAAGKPLTIQAEVQSPNGVKWVHLLYRAVNQTMEFKTLDMKAIDDKGHYEATVPGDQIDPKWDFMYYFETMDNQKNGKIYPDLNKETPYIVVRLTR